jgi:hypothetical protein
MNIRLTDTNIRPTPMAVVASADILIVADRSG